MTNTFLTSNDCYFVGDILQHYIFPISDDRVWESYVYDISGGDNFADFCEEFFELLDEEGYWD